MPVNMTEREPIFVTVVRSIRTILRNKWKFLAIFIVAFLLSVWILGRLDLLPEPDTSKSLSTITISQEKNSFPAAAAVAVAKTVEKPTRVVIDSVGVDVEVNNPFKTDIASLDNSLLSGVVRYPTSGKLGENGNVVIFGHSSYLPVVKNEYFKAFNGLQNLKRGETIEVYGDSVVYEYVVDRVYEADATDTRIPLTKDSQKLTLSTCNSFGDLNDRHVVEAHFVGSKKISS